MDKSKICHESVLLCYLELFLVSIITMLPKNFLGSVSAIETVDQGSITGGSN